MSQIHLNNDGQPIKILWFGDLAVHSGFGRIGNEITKRLHMRGWHGLIGASLLWDGWPPNPLPFHVRPLAGDPNALWPKLGQFIAEFQPDIIICAQDFPYSQTIFHALRVDWSKTKLIIITPIDGTPIHPEWVKMVGLADATMVISRFGVEAMRLAGQRVGLIHPAADSGEFYPAEDAAEVEGLRAKLGLAPDAFVMGGFMMNQGRKAIPEVIELFYEFARDKPGAVLYLDMDKGNPAGWDIPALLRQIEPVPSILVEGQRVFYREHALQAGLFDLRSRYLLCDVTCQFAHREGFGLPNLESQACKVPPMVIDWCSGSEIAGEGRGLLVRRIAYMSRGTWGGARDAFPDMENALSQLNKFYRSPDERQRLAAAGYEWAKEQTWDKATDAFEETLKRVVTDHKKARANEPTTPPAIFTIPAPGLSDIAGPAHVVSHHPDLQQPPGSVPLPLLAGEHVGLDASRDTGARRRKPRLQSDDPTPANGSEARPE